MKACYDTFKLLDWIGDSKARFCEFPEQVMKEMGYALYLAQTGDKSPSAKPLKGFGGASVLEVVENYDGDTYRAVYTVKFAGRVYVLHVFQKKSKHGVKTPQHEIDLIKSRLKRAEEDYKEWQRRK